jgi:hypothetical protein
MTEGIEKQENFHIFHDFWEGSNKVLRHTIKQASPATEQLNASFNL